MLREFALILFGNPWQDWLWDNRFTLIWLFWLAIAAYLYHLEQTVPTRLMTLGSKPDAT
jgi:hypothetical protein